MKGVIFAAGLGTRLYPLTKDKPKALVEVCGTAMLEHTLLKMAAASIRDVIVNVHAFAGLVESWLSSFRADVPSINIQVSDERDLLLETGGGLKKMKPLLADGPFLVHNVDVLSMIDFHKLIEADKLFHEADSHLHLATLAVRKTESDRYFLFNGAGVLCGWENVKTGEQKISRPEETGLQRFGFTGIHIIYPELLSLMTEEGVFSITDVYLRLAEKYDIRMFDVSDTSWFDIGDKEQLSLAESEWSKGYPMVYE